MTGRQLPIDALRAEVMTALTEGPVVVTAPTGSGKSTQVPRWSLTLGKTLVVEPRRVACRSLATHVAELEAGRVGDRVGYRVRDEDVSCPATQLLYVTPGVALRMLARDPALSDFAVVWLDELHERTLDLDLLLAVLQQHRIPRGLALGVMSATVAGDVIAEAMGGVHLHGEGRTFPVDITYAGQGDTLPRAEGL
ncbi:MAG: DEAD/DEAH box helicase, partial [Myxococcales bacterium]|nr:DEAD/DEAH box helicase [Myxococcales bacterium]